MSSQRFCLRWNNHQSNLLSVFDQLLHDESFVDVTLAVEGQLLRAHKMVLSACSPFFQALFVNHPDKHPIVILKDVLYHDMRSLLDFMYRGEVSVDQDRLTQFLRVAESLRIKGLTEVNEEKCDSIASSLSQQQQHLHGGGGSGNQVHHLQRLQYQQYHHQHQQQPHHQQQQQHHHNQKRYAAAAAAAVAAVGGGSGSAPNTVTANNSSAVAAAVANSFNMLGSALLQPKRKRGRPRKLSGSSNGTPGDDFDGGSNNGTLVRGSPELLEVKMGMDGFTGNNSDGSTGRSDVRDNDLDDVLYPPNKVMIKEEPGEPVASTSKEPHHHQQRHRTFNNAKNSSAGMVEHDGNSSDTQTTNRNRSSHHHQQQLAVKNENQQQILIGEPNATNDCKVAAAANSSNLKINATDNLNNNSSNTNNNTQVSPPSTSTSNQLNNPLAMVVSAGGAGAHTTDGLSPTSTPTAITTSVVVGGGGRQPAKRRVRRRATSHSQDPAEQLTEMSVRGLNLFRYASINEGVYQCTECAKIDVQKTFKNKYSFQRHAFLYHEGQQRKVFPCPVCQKEFSRPDKMKNHMKTVHDCFVPKEAVYPAVGYYHSMP